MSNQYIFDFGEYDYPDFDDFLGQGNAELVATLKAQNEAFVYLWGEAGSGKTSLLKAWIAQAQKRQQSAIYVDVAKTGLAESARSCNFLAVDGVADLNETEQIRLFSIFNQFKDQEQGFLLIAGDVPPWQLTVREDLRSRMGFCLVYEVNSLTDDEKIAALSAMANSRQLHVSEEVFVYLLNHWQRDIDSLVRMLVLLDHYSLAVKKPITVSLVKKILNQETDNEFSNF